jgi:3-methyladenine DNA glycosylase AlkD
MLKQLEKRLQEAADPERAKNSQWFFKTGPGQYGEGDVFIGLTGPEMRKIAKEFSGLSIIDIQKLLDDEVHEKRQIGLLILYERYKKACKEKNENSKKEIFEFYLKNAKKNNINNWDLVDISAPHIIGNYLLDKNREILYKLAISENLWEKRIAIISTAAFIRNNEFDDCLKISKMLLGDKHDLIHKAVGWMLREVGKKDQRLLELFLKENYQNLPRTALRYAIEKFEEGRRKRFLRGGFKNASQTAYLE